MGRKIEYHKSAFKHKGVTQADIEHAIKTLVYEEPSEYADDEYMLVGFDRAGNLLEVGFSEEEDGTVNIFHAMRAQKKWREKVPIWRMSYGKEDD